MSNRLDRFTVVSKSKAPSDTLETFGSRDKDLGKNQIQKDSASPLRSPCPYSPAVKPVQIPQKRKQTVEHRTITDFFANPPKSKERKKSKLKAGETSNEENDHDTCTIRAPLPLKNLWREITTELFLFPFHPSEYRVKTGIELENKGESDYESEDEDTQRLVRHRMTAKESSIFFSIIASEFLV